MSRVPGGVGAAGLVGCLCGRGWPRVSCVRAAIGVLWVRVYSPPPLFFVAAGVPLGCGESKGGGVGRVFSFFFLCEGCGLLWLLGGM